MQQAVVEKIAMSASAAILIAGIWYLSVQIMDTLEFLEMAYG